MTATAELDPLLTTDFIQEMVKQMRAIDSYGTYDGWLTNKPIVVTSLLPSAVVASALLLGAFTLSSTSNRRAPAQRGRPPSSRCGSRRHTA